MFQPTSLAALMSPIAYRWIWSRPSSWLRCSPRAAAALTVRWRAAPWRVRFVVSRRRKLL